METKPSSTATPRMIVQNCLVRLPAATNASGRCRNASTSANTSIAKAARPSSRVTMPWAVNSPLNMGTA